MPINASRPYGGKTTGIPHGAKILNTITVPKVIIGVEFKIGKYTSSLPTPDGIPNKTIMLIRVQG